MAIRKPPAGVTFRHLNASNAVEVGQAAQVLHERFKDMPWHRFRTIEAAREEVERALKLSRKSPWESGVWVAVDDKTHKVLGISHGKPYDANEHDPLVKKELLKLARGYFRARDRPAPKDPRIYHFAWLAVSGKAGGRGIVYGLDELRESQAKTAAYDMLVSWTRPHAKDRVHTLKRQGFDHIEIDGKDHVLEVAGGVVLPRAYYAKMQPPE